MKPYDSPKNRQLDVKDINTIDVRRRHLYKRIVDPLDPIYRLPTLQKSQSRVIGPIEG